MAKERNTDDGALPAPQPVPAARQPVTPHANTTGTCGFIFSVFGIASWAVLFLLMSGVQYSEVDRNQEEFVNNIATFGSSAFLSVLGFFVCLFLSLIGLFVSLIGLAYPGRRLPIYGLVAGVCGLVAAGGYVVWRINYWLH